MTGRRVRSVAMAVAVTLLFDWPAVALLVSLAMEAAAR